MEMSSILLVDDEPNVLAALRRSLMEEDTFRVIVARDAPEALQVLRMQHVDVVITDHDMPGMTGLALLDRVRESHPSIVRMMLSGKADLRETNDAVNSQAIYRFVQKPWEDTELRLMIRLALHHRLDQQRVRELSRLVAGQAALFAEIVARHPDCHDLLDGYLNPAWDAR